MTNQTTNNGVLNDCWNKIGVWGKGDCPELQKVAHCRNCPVYSSAAVQLLDRELLPGSLDEWTEHYGRQKQIGELKTSSVIIFRVSTEWLALPTVILQEVSEVRSIHSVPHRQNKMVLELVNIRGELLICVSLSEALGLDSASEAKRAKQDALRRRLLVVRREGSRFVFPVAEIHGIHDFHPQEIKEVPATVARAGATYTKGIVAWQDKSVGCLDDELLFYTLNRSLG